MEGAAADVHTAIAARLPSFPLTASVGGSAPQFSDMFATGNPFWSLIGGLAAPLFHGGTLRHQQRAAEAALEGSKAQYRAAALQAFIDVSDALTALKTDADALDAASRGEASAVRSLGYARRQLELGSVGTMQLLLANSTRSQAATQRIQAQSARLADTVALLVASGIPENNSKP